MRTSGGALLPLRLALLLTLPSLSATMPNAPPVDSHGPSPSKAPSAAPDGPAESSSSVAPTSSSSSPSPDSPADESLGWEERRKRSALRDPRRLWPSAVVPLEISPRYGPRSHSVIRQAIQLPHAVEELEAVSCVRFRPRRLADRSFVQIRPTGQGCHSLVGRQPGGQTISLDGECLSAGIVAHELMHSLGFVHEQSRHDRDSFVRFLRHNILPGAGHQFARFTAGEMANLGVGYDYASVMHYARDAFSRNGRPTLQGLRQGHQAMGNRAGLSAMDRVKLNRLYDCGGGRGVAPVLPPPTRPPLVPWRPRPLSPGPRPRPPPVVPRRPGAGGRCADGWPRLCVLLDGPNLCRLPFTQRLCPKTCDLCQ